MEETFWSPQAYTHTMRASVHAHAYTYTYHIEKHMKTERSETCFTPVHILDQDIWSQAFEKPVRRELLHYMIYTVDFRMCEPWKQPAESVLELYPLVRHYFFYADLLGTVFLS